MYRLKACLEIIIELRGMVGVTLRQRMSRNTTLSSAGVALHKSDSPGDEWMLKANVSPDHRIVCSGLACVFQEEEELS